MLALFTTLFAVSAPTAFAQDDDDIDDLDDDIDVGTPKPQPPSAEPDSPPADDGDDKDDGLDDFRDAGDGTDLLEGEPPPTAGGDTENIYRAANARLIKLEPDEELAGWEAYLEQYPNSAFRKRIESRMEELTDKIYEGGGGPTTTGPVDAMDQEIRFAQAMQLENIDPRSRLQVGFEWGLPDFLNLIGDYEHQLARSVSVHGGVRHRYLGWNLELGGRFALVKSVRTQTLLTAIVDFRMNTLPAYPALRPQLAIGKRFGPVDAQIQGGADISYRAYPGATDTVHELQPAAVGGASLYFAASEQVGMFAETSLYMRPVGADGAFEGGMFRFNVVDFGLKFYPGQKHNVEVNFGATVPYMQQWWQFHYGSVMGQLNYYL